MLTWHRGLQCLCSGHHPGWESGCLQGKGRETQARAALASLSVHAARAAWRSATWGLGTGPGRSVRQLDTVFKILAAFLMPVLLGGFDRQAHSLILILQRAGSTGVVVQLQTSAVPKRPGDLLCPGLKTFRVASLGSLCILLLLSTPYSRFPGQSACSPL